MNNELLIKFLLKETSPEEDQGVKEWLARDDANMKKFSQFRSIWETSKTFAFEHPIDSDTAWQRFKLLRDRHKDEKILNNLSNEENTHKAIPLNQSDKRKWFNIAATIGVGISLLLGVYFYWIAPKHPYFHTIEYTAGEDIRNSTLPDGTSITLNKHAKIAYTEALFGRKRKVTMEGEVFFDVQRNEKLPFEIVVNDVNVTVLGTSFNIKSNKSITEVIVETGMVQIQHNDVLIKLKPDEKAIAQVGEKGIEQSAQTDRLYDYYRSKVFKLEETPLWRFAEVLGEIYNVNITIESTSLGSLPITTRFDNDSLDNILFTLGETFQLQVERSGRNITIKK
ncbi:FecR domain-containing protein [Olivibacter sp. SDN3]|uniref:FecR family protein n=1 Tax=Olivibacter sp. SDN3 TaxID=2764720 RepID=UPI001651416B|nr:FecR family protein [Olivibacter sp. SDN3]QNL48616.1 FecR domain-containing protein [Olivibacter sp. SDN3]